MSTINNFFKLSSSDKRLVVKTLFLTVYIRMMLWLTPFKQVQKFSKKTVHDAKNETSERRLIWAVESVSYHVPGATCLTKALTAQYLLSRNGFPSLVKIGVGKDSDGQFEAHAWLEYAGEVVIGESEKEFVPIFDL